MSRNCRDSRTKAEEKSPRVRRRIFPAIWTWSLYRRGLSCAAVTSANNLHNKRLADSLDMGVCISPSRLSLPRVLDRYTRWSECVAPVCLPTHDLPPPCPRETATCPYTAFTKRASSRIRGLRNSVATRARSYEDHLARFKRKRKRAALRSELFFLAIAQNMYLENKSTFSFLIP